ncbi:MAG: hypothetical protein ACJ72Z_00525 [Pyrinomonadaceae bacterium]
MITSSAMMKLGLLSVLVLAFGVVAVDAQKIADLDQIKQVSQLPADVPQRANAIAFDGEKFWVPLYVDRGRIVTFDPKTETWDTKQDPKFAAAANRIFGKTLSPGGITFVDGKMWVANTYGDSFGWIDVDDPSTNMRYDKVIRPEWTNSQSYTDLTFDGTSIWASWLAGDYYGIDPSKTQLLLEINPKSGEVVSTFQIRFGGLADMAHGLAWDGENFWYGFQNSLRALDRQGKALAKYSIKGISRISGLAWDGEALWIIEFNGKLWRLPLKGPSLKQPA